MRTLSHLFDSNRRWAADILRRDPEFFRRLSSQQSPQYLWIGCSDSRVTASELVGLLPGEMFVHRNIANLVVHTDLNCLSVLQFAIEILKVKHVIVCGHYGCSGVRAALRRDRIGLSDNWLRHLQDVRTRYAGVLHRAPDEARAADLLCELNVIEQVANVCRTTIAADAWERGQELCVHGWTYGVGDGLLRDLNVTVTTPAEAEPVCRTAAAALA